MIKYPNYVIQGYGIMNSLSLGHVFLCGNKGTSYTNSVP